MMAFNWLDLFIIGLLGLSGLVGLMRGLVREVLSLVSWGLAIWVGITFGGTLEGYLENTIPSPTARLAAAFGIFFILTLLVTGMIGFLLTRVLESTGLSGIDRFAGLLFGLARGVLIIAVLVFLARTTPLPREPWWRDSQLMPMFQSIALWLEGQLPPGFVPHLVSKSVSH
jgi:membrane protein required for colicin V production